MSGNGFIGWIVSVSVPLACMGAAYVFTTARKNNHNQQNGLSSSELSNKSGGLDDSRKRKLEKKKRQREQRESALIHVLQSSTSSSQLMQPDSEESDDEMHAINEFDLEQLAILKKLANTSGPSSLSNSSSLSTLIASDSSIAMQPIATDNIVDEAKAWARVPTRNEEVIAGLKHKITLLTEQLEASSSANAEQSKNLNSSNRRIQSLELDMKEKTKAFAHQLNQLEGQLNGKSIELAAATEQLKNLASLSSDLKTFQDKLTQIQEELENSQGEIEKLSQSQQSLTQERDSVTIERDSTKAERDLLKSQVSSLQRQLNEAQRTNESMTSDFLALKKSTELELIEKNSQITALDEQFCSLKTKQNLEKKSFLIRVRLMNQS